MADSYLTISVIARDNNMMNRVTACAAQQGISSPGGWAGQYAYEWAAAPGWAEKWDYAVAGAVEEPGADPAVITDGDILAQIQSMMEPGN